MYFAGKMEDNKKQNDIKGAKRKKQRVSHILSLNMTKFPYFPSTKFLLYIILKKIEKKPYRILMNCKTGEFMTDRDRLKA